MNWSPNAATRAVKPLESFSQLCQASCGFIFPATSPFDLILHWFT